MSRAISVGATLNKVFKLAAHNVYTNIFIIIR